MPPATGQQTEQLERQEAPPEPAREKKTRPTTAARPRTQPPHAVVLHNDPVNEFDYVVGVLRKVFRYGGGKAFWLTLKAHVTGRCVVWTGVLEVAELKAQQVRDCGPDPRKPNAPPLNATTEPLPG
jgi:ATP-dependent Clp protease adaptor protein ClpS